MNPIKGETPLVLSDGREFTLIMDMEALVQAEEAYGKPLRVLMEQAQAEFIGAVRALLYGALRTKHEDLTLRDASEILMADQDAVRNALEEATKRGFPDASAQPEGKQAGNAKAPRGKTSRASGTKWA